jgi:hypothetical protein
MIKKRPKQPKQNIASQYMRVGVFIDLFQRGLGFFLTTKEA